MNKKNKVWIILFLIPSILLFVVIFAYPLSNVFYTSLLKSTATSSKTYFNGLQNYIYLFTKDKAFKAALINTSVWMLLQSTIHVFFGVVVALILSKKIRGWKFARAAFMIPNIISAAALGMLFMNILNPQIGFVNSFMKLIGWENFNVNWFADRSTAFFSVTTTWILYAGLICLLVMSEIGAIPDTVYESAKIDGANELQMDLYITLPNLKNIIGTGVIIAATSMITQFDLIYITTGGGPSNKTLNLGLYLYKVSNLEGNFGVSSAIGVTQIILGLIAVFFISKIFKIDEEHV
jgi:raffinose/stachyose/melibiose transport system permease protein